MTTTFETAKVGDKVWSAEYGWGVIQSTSYTPTYPILVVFGGDRNVSFMLNGLRLPGSKNQTLFWDEVVIEAPHKPLPELAVDTKVLVWDDVNTKYKRHFSHFSNGLIYAFDNGRTSFTSLHEKSVTGWDFWELAE